ncbi:MAG TPA: phosphatidate cytidylyltransferase, partial [Chloroflexota bacterium]|nr:phosphatidate cytidylyltransferase [Chloroflexota bacterium]
MLAARLATSFVAAPIVLVLVWLGGPSFWVASAIAAAQAARETQRLLSARLTPALTWTIIVGTVVVVLAAAIGPVASIGVLGLASLALQVGWVLGGPSGSRATVWAIGVAAIVSGGLPFAILVLLRSGNGPPIDLESPLGPLTLPNGAGWVLV